MLSDPIKTNLVGPDQPKIINFDKTCSVFLDFQKTKDMEPSEIKSKKNINNLIMLTPAYFCDISHFCHVVQL